MEQCTEIAIFVVDEAQQERVIELSHSIFMEMNEVRKVILDAKVLKNTQHPNQLCWQLHWVNQAVAKEITAQWPKFPSTAEFQSLVGDNIYYGHFIPT